jgi:hypothetical protein
VSCRVSWHADVAGKLVEYEMTGGTTPEIEILWGEGSDHTAEVERVQDELDNLAKRRLPRRDEQAERERLWARLDEMEALLKVAPTRELTLTGRTWGEAWLAGRGQSGRRIWDPEDFSYASTSAAGAFRSSAYGQFSRSMWQRERT